MQWVEEYLREKGYLDTVKLLRIYDMSATRGGAHHTCQLAPVSLTRYDFVRISLVLVGFPPCVVARRSLFVSREGIMLFFALLLALFFLRFVLLSWSVQ